MAKAKQFQNTDNSLSLVWGSPQSATNQGGRTTSARHAGVTRDHRLTPFAQKLAAELAQDTLAQNLEKDPRTQLEKQYNIRDGVAHVTTDEFRNLLLKPTHFRKVESHGVHKIVIDNGFGFQATMDVFSAHKNDVPSWDCSNIIYSQQVNKHGLTACLSGNKPVVLLSQDDIYGLLSIHNIPDNIAAHRRTRTPFETRREKAADKGNNFSTIFRNAALMKLHVEHAKGQGGTDIYIPTRTQNGDSQLHCCGKLFHPNDEALGKDITARLMAVPFSTATFIQTTIKAGVRSSLVQAFEKSSGLLICNREDNIAVLVRPGADAPHLLPPTRT